MARRKDYYGSNNKKTKAGMNLLESFFKVAIWLFIFIFTMLVDFVSWAYNKYKNRNKAQ